MPFRACNRACSTIRVRVENRRGSEIFIRWTVEGEDWKERRDRMIRCCSFAFYVSVRNFVTIERLSISCTHGHIRLIFAIDSHTVQTRVLRYGPSLLLLSSSTLFVTTATTVRF